MDLGCDSECPKLTPPNIQHFQIFQIFQYAHYAQYAQYAIKPSQAISNHLPSPRIQKLQPSPPKDQPKLWAEDAEVEDVEAGDEMVEMWHDVTRVKLLSFYLIERLLELVRFQTVSNAKVTCTSLSRQTAPLHELLAKRQSAPRGWRNLPSPRRNEVDITQGKD